LGGKTFSDRWEGEVKSALEGDEKWPGLEDCRRSLDLPHVNGVGGAQRRRRKERSCKKGVCLLCRKREGKGRRKERLTEEKGEN